MEQRGVLVSRGCGRGEQSCLDYCCCEQQAEATKARTVGSPWKQEAEEAENKVDRSAQAVGGER